MIVNSEWQAMPLGSEAFFIFCVFNHIYLCLETKSCFPFSHNLQQPTPAAARVFIKRVNYDTHQLLLTLGASPSEHL